MGIYRGPGGTGDAVNDAASEATLVSQLVTQAQESEANAAASATAAQTAENNAETAETNAATSATNAASSAASALSSKNAAATSATNAASSASAASTSASNAATSATNSANSATSASTSASTATTQATNAANSATAAATSATNAANSATASATSATNSANSATASATSATNAANSATAAAASAVTAAGYVVPSQTGNAGKYLKTDGTAVAWDALDISTADIAGTLPVANGGTGSTTSSGARTNLAVPGTAVSNTFSANQIISVTDNTNAALRVTQLGSGNALLVEDSTNPDSSPFVIDASGFIIQGYTANITSNAFQSNSSNPFSGIRWNAANTGPTVTLGKSRSPTIGTYAIVSSGDDLGTVSFAGDDGTKLVTAASILSEVDGTPGADDMPGRLVFSTTADGASTPTERMRITSAGNVGIGTTSTSTKLTVAGDITVGVIDNTAKRVIFQGAGGVGYSSGINWQRDAAIDNSITVDDSESLSINFAQSDLSGRALLFKSGSTGTERMRIDSSGNVGIGTSSVTAIYGPTLQIGNSSTNSTLSITGSGTGNIGDVYLAGTVDTALLYARTSTPLAFGTNDIERMRIDSSGNVCINTTTPVSGAKLTIAGSNIAFSGASYIDMANSSNAIISKPTAAAFGIGPTGGLNSSNPFWYGVHLAAPLVTEGGANRFPRASLYYSYTTATDPTDLTFNIGLANAGTLAHNLALDAGNGFLALRTLGTERMRIGTNGFVGIGTSAQDLGIVTVDGGGLAVRSGNAIFLRPVGNAWDMRLQAVGTSLNVVSGGDPTNAIATFAHGGNVGIGTTGPTQKLDIVGTSPTSGTMGLRIHNSVLTSLLAQTGSTYSYNGAGANELLLYNAGGPLTLLADGQAIKFCTGSSEKMRVHSSGGVSIGSSTDPGTQNLSVTQNVLAGGSLVIGSSGTYTPGCLYSDSNWGMVIRAKQASPTAADFLLQNSAGTERLRIGVNGELWFNSGYGSVAAAYGCRAWVNFNGTGTVAIRASGNVSSIGDNGVGNYTVNLTTAMPDTNYNALISCSDDVTGGSGSRIAASIRVQTTSSVQISSQGVSSASYFDSIYCAVSIFR